MEGLYIVLLAEEIYFKIREVNLCDLRKVSERIC